MKPSSEMDKSSGDCVYVNHASRTMEKIQEHLQRNQLCDVVIVVGSKRMKAHRLVLSSVSDYFRAMFNNDVRESHEKEITMNGVDADILESLIQYMYSAKLEINQENVENILSVANMLQLHPVVNAGCSFLVKQLHPSNSLGIRAFADLQSCFNLQKEAHDATLEQFTEVIQNQEFLMLPLTEVCDLLSSDDVNVPNEATMFEALLSWVRYSEEERKIHMPKLLSYIRLNHMMKEEIADVVQKNPLVNQNLECEHQIVAAMTHHMLPERRPSLSSPRKSTMGHLFAVGGMDSTKGATSIEKYDVRHDCWRHEANLTGRRLQFGVAVLEDRLYVVGGRDGLKTLNSMECFNSSDKTWSVMPPIATHRHGLGVAVLHGPMYAVGGHDGWSYLNTVERWDPQARSWNYVTPMSVSRSTMGIAVLFDKLYAVGGRDGSSCLRSVECFDPHTNKWTNCAPMSKRRGGIGVGVCGAHLYAVGGHDAPSSNNTSKLSQCVERYSPKTDQWTIVASMKVPRDAAGIIGLGGRLYACGGYDGQSYVATCESYDPQSNEWTDVGLLNTARAGTVVVHVRNLL